MATYAEINSAWPENMPVPTSQEAIAGARRLVRLAYRHAHEEGSSLVYVPQKFKIVTGNRYTYWRGGVWCINPNGQHFGGWRDIVHGISHWAGRRFWPNEKPHSLRHVWIEKMLADYVIANFLDEQLKRREKHHEVVTSTQLKMDRAARIATRMKKWMMKKRRAENALRKLNCQARYYERTLAS